MSLRGEWKEIVKLATPVVISKLSFTVMGLVDTGMVGRLGAAQQGAVGIATTYMFTLYVFGLGIIGVVNTFVSQNHGAGKLDRCGEVLGNGLKLATVVGAATLAILLCSEPLFSLAGLSEEVAGYGFAYMSYRVIGLFGVFWYWVYNGFMEGIGETKAPMWITIAANFVNVVLDYALIFGLGPIPAMGVEGAGLATAGANLFILVCFAVLIHRPRSPYRRFGVGRVFRSTDWRMMGRMIRIGLPMGAQFFLEIGAFLFFSIMVGWTGDDALAAHQVALRVLSLSFMTAWGISVAATTLVGRHQGEGRYDLARAAGMRTVILVLGYTLVVGVVFAVLPAVITGLFTPFAKVASLATTLMYAAAAIQVFDGLNIVAYGALKGAGDTRWPLVAVILANWLLGVPLVYVLTITLGLGVLGTWLGILGVLMAQGLAMFLRFRKGKWRYIEVVDESV